MEFQDTRFLRIGVGGPSPYPVMADGAKLDIGPGGLTLIVSMSNPSKAEIRAIRRGRMEVGMIMAGSTAVLLWRFKPEHGQQQVELESVFHIGLLPPDKRRVPSGEAGRVHGVLILLQDERATCRALRFLSLPADISDAIDAVVEMQAKQASQPGWNRRSHEAEVEAYYRDFPSPADTFAMTDLARQQPSSAVLAEGRLA